MKKMKNRTLHLGIHRIAILLLLLGVLLGTIFANLFKDIYLSDITLTNSMNISKINTLQINYGSLLKFVLENNYKKYFLLWILSATVIGIPFMVLFIVYHGFCTGFIISISTMQYGLKGILLFLAYIFPQYLIYIPIYIFALWKGYDMCINMYYNTKTNMKSKMGVVIERLPFILVLAVMLLLGSIVETYFNTFILQKVSTML